MAKKLIFAAALTLSLMLGAHQVTFAEEIHEPTPTSETATAEDTAEPHPENSSLETSVGGGNNSADSDADAADPDQGDQAGEEESSELDLGNWPIILSLGAIALALIFIVVLNLRHRS